MHFYWHTLYHVYYFSRVSEQADNCNYRYWHEIFAEKLTKNSDKWSISTDPIKHHRTVIAYVGLQYRKIGHVNRKENEVISNDIWLINIHELVSNHLWKSTKSTWVCPMVVWAVYYALWALYMEYGIGFWSYRLQAYKLTCVQTWSRSKTLQL